MIQLNTGVPGSGKTYFVVKQIVDIAKDKKSKYKKIFTNINGLKYEELNKINSNLVFESLYFDDLLEEIEKEFLFYSKNKKLHNYDDTIKELGILSKFYDSLIVIDECHTLLDSSDSMKRFITYHRHWNIDLILITQAKSELDKVYLRNVENLIVAQAPAKRFLNFGFRYFYYSSTSEFKTNLYQKQTIFLSKNYSKYYDSGSSKLSKSQFLRFLVPIFLMGFASYFFYQKFVLGRFSDKAKQSIENNITEHNRTRSYSSSYVQSQSVSDNFDKKYFYKISCYKNHVCKLKNNSYVFQEAFFKQLFKDHNCTLKFTQTGFGITDNVFVCNSDDFNSILGVLNDVKKTDFNNTSKRLF